MEDRDHKPISLTLLPLSHPRHSPKQYVGSFSVDDLDTQESVWLVQQQLWALKVGSWGGHFPGRIIALGWQAGNERPLRLSDPPHPPVIEMSPREGPDQSHSERWAPPSLLGPHPMCPGTLFPCALWVGAAGGNHRWEPWEMFRTDWTSYGPGSGVARQEPFTFPRLLGGSAVQGSVLRQAGWSWLIVCGDWY